MTNTLALWLGGIILCIFAVDALAYDGTLPVTLGRLLLDILAWMAFWR